MKKILIALLGLFIVTGCDKNEEGDNSGPTEEDIENYRLLEGTWVNRYVFDSGVVDDVKVFLPGFKMRTYQIDPLSNKTPVWSDDMKVVLEYEYSGFITLGDVDTWYYSRNLDAIFSRISYNDLPNSWKRYEPFEFHRDMSREILGDWNIEGTGMYFFVKEDGVLHTDFFNNRDVIYNYTVHENILTLENETSGVWHLLCSLQDDGSIIMYAKNQTWFALKR